MDALAPDTGGIGGNGLANGIGIGGSGVGNSGLSSGGLDDGPPNGFAYLTGADGAYLLGADGAYLLGVYP